MFLLQTFSLIANFLCIFFIFGDFSGEDRGTQNSYKPSRDLQRKTRSIQLLARSFGTTDKQTVSCFFIRVVYLDSPLSLSKGDTHRVASLQINKYNLIILQNK